MDEDLWSEIHKIVILLVQFASITFKFFQISSTSNTERVEQVSLIVFFFCRKLQYTGKITLVNSSAIGRSRPPALLWLITRVTYLSSVLGTSVLFETVYNLNLTHLDFLSFVRGWCFQVSVGMTTSYKSRDYVPGLYSIIPSRNLSISSCY